MKKASNKNSITNVLNDEEIDFSPIIKIIQAHRHNVYRKINEELVTMYYEIGEYISKKLKQEKWGSGAIDRLVGTINKEFPDMKSMSKRGLYRSVQFYEIYHDHPNVSPLVSQISWTNNLIIFSHKTTIEEKEFYIRLL